MCVAVHVGDLVAAIQRPLSWAVPPLGRSAPTTFMNVVSRAQAAITATNSPPSMPTLTSVERAPRCARSIDSSFISRRLDYIRKAPARQAPPARPGPGAYRQYRLHFGAFGEPADELVPSRLSAPDALHRLGLRPDISRPRLAGRGAPLVAQRPIRLCSGWKSLAMRHWSRRYSLGWRALAPFGTSRNRRTSPRSEDLFEPAVRRSS